MQCDYVMSKPTGLTNFAVGASYLNKYAAAITWQKSKSAS